MDSDVALLASYANYLTDIAASMAPLANDLPALQTAVSSAPGTNLNYFADMTSLQGAAAAVNPAVVSEYVSILQQSSADLQDLISGQLPSTFDPTSLGNIAAWLAALGTATASMQGSASDLSALPNVTGPIADINTAYTTIYQAGLTPSIASLNFTRIVGRMNSLATGLTPKPRTSNPPGPSGVQNTSSGSTFLYLSLAGAIVGGGWWLMKKGHSRSEHRRRSR